MASLYTYNGEKVFKGAMRLCPVTFGVRAAFHRSSAKGETAAEIDPTGKAGKEAEELWKWLGKKLKKLDE